ncbi:MAG TPA: hypothetical protein VLH09_14870, partial [Bryobacteraceae bacterium]|nr:hypothetical protein [Bryobacteraceae bacterium]
MSSKARLLWICPQTPAPGGACLSEALIGYDCDFVPGPSEAFSCLRSVGADLVVASFPLEGWHP